MDSITARKLEYILSGYQVSSEDFNEIIDLMDTYKEQESKAENLPISDVIERTDIKLPKLNGDLKRIQIQVQDRGKVQHTWLVFHGMRTFAGKEPFRVHLGRNVL